MSLLPAPQRFATKLPGLNDATASPAAYPSPNAANPLETIGFLFVQVYLFLLMSRATEFVDSTGKLHFVLIVALLAIVFSVLSFRFFCAFNNKIGLMLAAFTAWLIFEIPFSSWRGGSTHALTDSWLKSYLTYIVVVALVSSLARLRAALTCLAFATAVIVGMSFKLGVSSEADSRFYFAGGTLANSNDLAMELLIGLPFLLYVGTDRKRSFFVRIPALAVIPVLLYVVLKTGSRAGLIATFVMALMLFFRTTSANRIKIVAVGALLTACLPFFLPKDVRERYTTLLTGTKVTSDTSDVVKSAAESQAGRMELIVHALILTAEHPLFGVGLYQFPPSSADISIRHGQEPMWHPVHSFLFLVMAETGIPGVILYTAALLYCLGAMLSISRFTARHKELVIAGELSETLLYSFAGLFACMLFSPSAYLFHFPLMAALVTALYHLTRQQIESEKRNAQPAAFAWIQPRPAAPGQMGKHQTAKHQTVRQKLLPLETAL